MPIRHPSTCPVNRGEYFDTIELLAEGGYDDENSPDDSTTPATTATLACSVLLAQSSQITREEDGPTPYGVTRYEIPLAPPAGADLAAVLAVVADGAILWTADASGPLDPPIRLAADGPARPPGGLMARWSISATARR